MSPAGLDLSAVERVILSWAIDELEIHRDNGVSDDELDPETLQLIPAEGELVWDGLGALQPLAGFADEGDPDVVRIVDETGARYRALLPLRDVTGARVGDVLTAKALHSPSADPRLQGRAFSIVHLGYPSSFAVASIIYLRPVLDPAAATTPPDTAPGAVELDEVVDLFGSTTWDGAALVGDYLNFVIPGRVLEPSTTYAVTVAYGEGDPDQAVLLQGIATPDEAGAGAPYLLGADYVPELVSGTVVLTIGPAVEAWDDAMDNAATYVYVTSGAHRITGITFEPPLLQSDL